MTVKPPPTLSISTSLQNRAHRFFRLLEEDEILRPLFLAYRPVRSFMLIYSRLTQAQTRKSEAQARSLSWQ